MVLLERSTLRRAFQRGLQRTGGLSLPIALLLALALAVAACGFIGYALWPSWPAGEAALDAPALPITVGGTPFNIPPGALRIPIQRRAGAQERVDLAFAWPSLDPPDASSDSASPADPEAAATRALDRIFVTIAAAGETLSPEERVRTIYPRYATSTPAPGPDGLAVLAFQAGTPYDGEDLIYDAATPTNFLVRCSRPTGPTPGTCLLSHRIGGADIVVRFPRDWLEDWRFVGRNIERLIGSLQ